MVARNFDRTSAILDLENRGSLGTEEKRSRERCEAYKQTKGEREEKEVIISLASPPPSLPNSLVLITLYVFWLQDGRQENEQKFSSALQKRT